MREPEEAERRPSLLPSWLWISPVAIMLLIGLAGAAAFAIVALTLRDSPSTAAPGYYGTVAELAAEAAEDLAALAPSTVLADCLSGVATACAAQEANARAAAARVAELSDEIGANSPPFRAVIWHSAYLDALAELRSALVRQAEALAARDAPAFEQAVQTTRDAVALEVRLTDEFNQDFADQLR